MINKAGIFAPIFFCVLSTAALELSAENNVSCPDGSQDIVVIEIDYGNALPSRIVKIPCVKGITVLGVLQTIAVVETQPVGSYVFITSIDGIKGKRGEMAWYYSINGQPAKELAYSRVLNGNERIKWIYTKDVCSWKVDGKHDIINKK